ncbi:peptidoglycan recognition protein family protein [Galbibacter mesophilus]|uniref:peptidoglycan recognition protein family protein n=1 Tax=Galbibacter mesophilus TaxID=379069 RepID=UPI00191D19CC|nr:peptidoglycan recognition family protein [Galbibacter mesophilus]MCM5661690.1 peptidoglycan recognition protein family protein [Galbibacter mesophilus]
MKKKNTFLLVAIVSILFSCGPKIVEEPILFNDERNALTKDYMKMHYDLDVDSPTILPKMVVVHWTAIPSFQKSFDAFYDVHLPSFRTAISGGGSLNVSSHFLVDQDGTIYKLMPETTMARHVIGLNHCAIGIENVGGPDMPLTKAQLKANIKLIKYLKKKYPIDYVIGHYEYQLFEDHELWLEQDEGYRTEKSDPDEAFMADIRKNIAHLDLKTLPEN